MSWLHFFTVLAQAVIGIGVLALVLLIAAAVLSVVYNNFKEDK